MANHKRLIGLVPLLLLLTAALTGCWNYRGLDQMTIVAGVAIDKAEDGRYHLTFEVVDMSKPAESNGVTSITLESDGATLFDAIRNAKKQDMNQLYFGNMQIMIVSNEIAREEGLSAVLDIFVRATEFREVINAIISQEDTAGSLLMADGLGQGVLSYAILEIITDDGLMTSATKDVKIYQAYNTLKTEGGALVLPAFHLTEDSNGVTLPELNGLALFSGDKLAGYMPAEDVKYYLCAVNKLEGGVLTADVDGDGTDDLALDILSANTDRKFSLSGDQPSATLKIALSGKLIEYNQPANMLDPNEVKRAEKALGEKLSREMAAHLLQAQQDYGWDIFGFGEQVYHTQLPVWRQVKENWQTLFGSLTFDVQAKVTILSTATTQES